MTKTLKACILGIASALATNLVSAELPPNIGTYLRDTKNAVTEDRFLPLMFPETADFIRSVTANWRAVLESTPQIAPECWQQSAIVVAGEFLPPPEYLAFVNSLCDLREQGHLTSDTLSSVLWASMAKSGFLAYNYDHPDVVPVIGRLETLMLKDHPTGWNEFFVALKSGELKGQIIERRKRDGDPMPEKVSNYDKTPYLQLAGGNVGADIKLLAQRPVEAVTSLASANRIRWSMVVAVGVAFGSACGIFMLFLRWRRRVRRGKDLQ